MIALALALLVQPVAERQLMLTGFDRVRVDGPFTVTIATGGSAGARVTGAPAALEMVTLRVEGGVLVIAPARDDRGRPRGGPAPVVTVHAGRVAGLAIRGGGTVRIDRMVAPRVDLSLTGDGAVEVGAIDAGQLDLRLIGAGSATLAGRAGQARVLVNGAAGVAADGLRLDELVAQSSGTGQARYRVRYAADISASGSGSVTVAGGARCRTRGTATIRCASEPQAGSRAITG
ncbi:head GIN domain-containing protein [Sphingomonas sp. VNH70]|uniref:head GIN domain-containing protein n=1 Tax=Sphingomonas silueang TaxID=3156617 RepID=UPI0032B49E62